MPQIDVIGQADIIIPRLEELVRFDKENSDKLQRMKVDGVIENHEQSERQYRELVMASRGLVTEVWGKLPSDGKEHNLQSGGKGYSAQGRELEGHNVLSHSTDANIVGCVVYGWNPLNDSIRPHVRDSFVLGHNAVSGSGFFHHLPVEEYTSFVELEPHILSSLRLPEMRRDLDRTTDEHTNAERKLRNLNWPRYVGLKHIVSRWEGRKETLSIETERLTHEINTTSERVLLALYDFSRVVPDSEHERTANWFEKARPDIAGEYSSLIDWLRNSLPEDKQKELQHVVKDPKVVTAAHIADSILHQLSFSGDAYHVDIANSVVFGWNAGNNIKGGVIQNSIFAGYNPLSGANVTVRNSYLVTARGKRYIGEEVLGNPQTYQTIPESVQKKGLSLRDLHNAR